MSKKRKMGHEENMRRIHKKISKPVLCDGKVFESGLKAARYLKLYSHTSIYRHIKEGHYKGIKLEYYKGVNDD